MNGTSGLMPTDIKEQSIVIVDDMPDNLHLFSAQLPGREHHRQPTGRLSQSTSEGFYR